jgi:hypothetical protein
MVSRDHCVCRPSRFGGYRFKSGHPSEPTLARLAFRHLSRLDDIRICGHIERRYATYSGRRLPSNITQVTSQPKGPNLMIQVLVKPNGHGSGTRDPFATLTHSTKEAKGHWEPHPFYGYFVGGTNELFAKLEARICVLRYTRIEFCRGRRLRPTSGGPWQAWT